ncbi:tRNA (adenosine(37)-N6)-threonylcarbamoyltransferase complex dimerization subunit type 1 TsaB [Ferrovibrio sp.]|uniref:tRNA (adenosine(37)-N6)-threonylcarbamoyltransferase complex dimerization subunit type 1 TsaB n=3 Tax=Ferrovibrio sp. TaxID=1917215 RepID=UPI003516A8B6
MKLLAVDTALNACSAAIVEAAADGRDCRVLARVVSPGGRGNAERLLPVLDEACAAAGLAVAGLDGFAATIGPGSFTGIRTALATARALGLATGKPVRGVTTTAALAAAAAAQMPGLPVAAVIDARRGEVYLQIFDAQPSPPGAPLTEPLLLPVAAAAARLPDGNLLLVGSGGALLREALPQRGDLVLSAAAPDPDPVVVARLAMAMPVPAQPPSPLYVRPPDAALPPQPQPRARLGVTVRPCGVEAAELLAALHAEAFTAQDEQGWSADSIGRLLAMPGALPLLAAAGDQPAGFLLLRLAADEAEIVTLAVRPRLQRLGVARALLQAGLAEAGRRGARQCFLEVADDNTAARAAYAAAGFAEVGRRRDYYDGKQKNPGDTVKRRDALVLKCTIS